MAGGTLKMKGDDNKKKKRSSKSKELSRGATTSLVDAETLQEDETHSSRLADAPPTAHKTEAERRFEQIQRERLAKRAIKEASKSHKDRVSEFNDKLSKMSEHYDLPKARCLQEPTISTSYLAHRLDRVDTLRPVGACMYNALQCMGCTAQNISGPGQVMITRRRAFAFDLEWKDGETGNRAA